MKITKKALVLALCMMLVSVMSIFGTIAYLTDDDSAVNTFTVGKVTLSLDEADVNENGTLASNERVKGNEYHLIPGHTYIKDPTVTMGEDSELAYVRMLVTVENIDQLEAALNEEKYYAAAQDGSKVFLLQDLCLDKDGNNTWASDKWIYEGYDEYTEVVDEEEITNGVYEFRYYKVVNDETAPFEGGKLEPLFGTITVPGEDVDNNEIAKLEDVKITVIAHAIQAPGFATDDLAWDAFDKQN